MNPFRQSIGPVSNSYGKIIFLLMFSLFRAGVILTIVLPRLDYPLAYAAVGVFFMSLLSFFISTCKNPGYTNNNKNLKINELFDIYRGDYICAYCETRKPRHARHCHYCKRCVKVIAI